MKTARRFLVFPLLLLLTACRNTNQDLLESELRTREWQVRDLKEALGKSHHLNQALLYEIGFLRQGVPIAPEVAAQTFTLKRITLGRLTGGVDRDGCLGDEALEIHVEPRDGDDHTIKAPGSLHVIALEILPEGLKNPIGSWEIPQEQLRRSWKSGLLSNGYAVTVPWQNPPKVHNVRVVARLVLADGRAFEADKDIRVHPKNSASDLLLPPPRQVETFWRPSRTKSGQ